jgi:hypothetical protein
VGGWILLIDGLVGGVDFPSGVGPRRDRLATAGARELPFGLRCFVVVPVSGVTCEAPTTTLDTHRARRQRALSHVAPRDPLLAFLLREREREREWESLN